MKAFELLREMMMNDRSVRRFDEQKAVDESELRQLVELTRYCASGRNLQPLRYRMVTADEELRLVGDNVKWAGYLTDWDGPAEGERPRAYLIQCLDTGLCQNPLCDDGLQLQTLTLGATAIGLRGCIIKSFNAAEIAAGLRLPERMKPLYVLALGYPVERVVIEPIGDDGDVKYYRSEDGTHHVPKRRAEDLVIE